MEGKWIRFQLATRQNPKTQVWDVLATADETILGEVRWFGRWRCYAFLPKHGTLYEQQCLRDVAAFIEERTREHRAKKRLA